MDSLKLQAFLTLAPNNVSVKSLAAAAQCIARVGRNKAFRNFHTKEKECGKVIMACKRRDFIC